MKNNNIGRITIKDTNSLVDALPIMNSHHFRRLAIINNEPKLVEILTDKDIFKELLGNKQLLCLMFIITKILYLPILS